LGRLFEKLIQKDAFLLKPVRQRGQQRKKGDHHADGDKTGSPEGRDAYGV